MNKKSHLSVQQEARNGTPLFFIRTLFLSERKAEKRPESKDILRT